MEETVTSAPVSAPVAPATPSATPPESTSIADHAATFQPGMEPVESAPVADDAPLDDVVDDDSPQGRMRGSRAKSKQAAARINKLVAERNEMRDRLARLEAAQQQAKPSTPTPTPRPAPVTPFNKPEPTIDQFVDRDDPYGAHLRASMKWELEREAHEAAAQARTAYEGYQTQQAREEYRQAEFQHQQRLVAAIASDPGMGRAIQAIQDSARSIPPLLDQTIVLDPNGVDIVRFLASNPAVLDEIALITATQAVNESNVARTRRLLRQRMTAGVTGSVAPSPVLPTAPRPPNPVRTGSMRPTNDAPGEGASIADHAKYWPAR